MSVPKLSTIAVLLLIVSLVTFSESSAQRGLVINEISNGPAGTEEYYEFLVVSDAGNTCPLDIRGWIFDDNNGDFSCGPRTAAGIAQGHARFDSSSNWSSIPVGALIVVYNDGDMNATMPAADPYDANNDSVYVIPISNPNIQVSSGSGGCSGANIPVGCTASCASPTGNSAYTPATYTSGGAWLGITLRNSGDAGQTRFPDGTYFHGISFGDDSDNINGGPDAMRVATGSGTQRAFCFGGSDYRVASNYTSGTVGTSQTPGAPNNAANASFISSLTTGNCLLPVEYARELSGTIEDGKVMLNWATAVEINNDRFEILATTDPAQPFQKIGQLTGNGTTSEVQDYQYTDTRPMGTEMWYRLAQYDLNGEVRFSKAINISLEGRQIVTVYPQPATETVNFMMTGFDGPTTLQVYDLMGKLIHSTSEFTETSQAEIILQLSGLKTGTYIYRITNKEGAMNGRFLIQ